VAGLFALCAGAGHGGEALHGVADGRENRQPLVQAADLQHFRHPRLQCDQLIAAPSTVGVVGDLDEGAEPTDVAKRQAAQIEQQQPGMGGGGTTPRGQAGGGGHIQLIGRVDDLDTVTAARSRRLLHALSHCRSALPSVPVNA
jgi:hypothetical protein